MSAEYKYHRHNSMEVCDMQWKPSSFLFRFLVRSVIGMGLIFVINQYVLPEGNLWKVGLNAVSFLTSGTLGIPGVCLLYGILIYQTL